MTQRELTDASSVVPVEQGPWDKNSIKMFRRQAGKDFVVIVRDSGWKNLPCKSKRACRNCPVLFRNLGSLWRTVLDFKGPGDTRHPSQIWNNLFQELQLLGAQFEPSNACDVSSRLREAGYETHPHGLPCAEHDDRNSRRLPL